jgi:hypothetical protein
MPRFCQSSGNAVEGLRYLVTLDELNRFAPKGGKDPITEMIERVAAEMRSQGIILLGAQQEASRVSPRVQASFRAPMLAKIPFPPWALRKEEQMRNPPLLTAAAAPSLTADEI